VLSAVSNLSFLYHSSIRNVPLLSPSLSRNSIRSVLWLFARSLHEHLCPRLIPEHPSKDNPAQKNKTYSAAYDADDQGVAERITCKGDLFILGHLGKDIAITLTGEDVVRLCVGGLSLNIEVGDLDVTESVISVRR
jgi:hypothetical protein